MTESKKSGRGGVRPGAGRKPLTPNEASVVLQVRMSKGLRKTIFDLGGSTWARGVLTEKVQSKLDGQKANDAALYPQGAIPVVVGAPQPLPMGFSAVQAGFPSPAENYQENAVDLNDLLVRNPPSTFLIYAKGDSMVDAGINSGDLMVVDRSLTAKNGDIVIMQINNEFTVKRLVKQKDGSFYLHPENHSGLFKDIYPNECEEWKEFGVVTHVIKTTAAEHHA